jgi:signal transduction histidine kinase
VKKTFHTWVAFLVCLAILFTAMAWLSWTMLRLDKAEESARHQVIAEENVRLALWRMDSALTPIISQESVYPYFYFRSYYPASRAYFNMFNDVSSDLKIPSPLKDNKSPYIFLHFQFDPEGILSSPEVPDIQIQTSLNAKSSQNGEESPWAKLERLKSLVDREVLVSNLEEDVGLPAIRQDDGQWQPREDDRNPTLISQSQVQRSPGFERNEWEKRMELSQQAIGLNIDNNARNFSVIFDDNSLSDIMKPLWLKENLFLVRRINVKGQEYIQGCWMDWNALKSWMLDSISDLLPNATLKPSLPGSGNGKERMLATLPVILNPGQVPVPEKTGLSPIVFVLLIAWICVLIAAGSAGMLLFGTISLSERRAAFVSAVTHELRTPLTTLRMYTEMLSEGMIEDSEKSHNYLETIRTESERLGHLVENVLTYARLERRRLKYNHEIIPVNKILLRTRERLSRRAAQSGMKIVMIEQDADRSPCVKVDFLVIEQILFNLVDNSCKYASNGNDRRIHIESGVEHGKVFIKVRDHGPGISEKYIARLFHAFGKSAPEAANSAPGVGLGLALCRRLAGMMSGNLYLDPSVVDGACFVLNLPNIKNMP